MRQVWVECMQLSKLLPVSAKMRSNMVREKLNALRTYIVSSRMLRKFKEEVAAEEKKAQRRAKTAMEPKTERVPIVRRQVQEL